MQNKNIITILEGPVLGLLAVLVVGAVGTWYLFKIVANTERNLETASNDYETTLAQLDSFDEIKNQAESTKDVKNEMENLVVSADNTLALIEELERAAAVAGVSLKTDVGEKPGTTKKIATGPSQFPGTLTGSNANKADQEVWLDLTVGGNFGGILKFVRYLENSRKLIAVSTINLSQASTMAPDDVLENYEGVVGQLKAVILVTNVF